MVTSIYYSFKFSESLMLQYAGGTDDMRASQLSTCGCVGIWTEW